MAVMPNLQTERENQRIQALRAELVALILRALPEDGHIQPLDGLFLYRSSVARLPTHSIVKPSFCVIAQGSKEVILGESCYRYAPFHYLIYTLDLPRVSQVTEASKEKPYLSFRLEFDPALVDAVIMETSQLLPHGSADARSIDVSPLDVNLQDAVVRLVRLIDSRDERQVRAPLLTREIKQMTVGHLAGADRFTGPALGTIIQVLEFFPGNG